MAKIYNVHDAKSSLSRIIEEVLAGHEVTIARAGKPLIDLSVHEPTTERAKPGFMKGLIKVNDAMTEDEIWAAEPFKSDLFTQDETLNAAR